MLRSSIVFASFALVAACSSSSSDSSDGTTPNDGSIVGDIREAVTWEDGTRLGGVVRIVEGAEVTIAPGAKITCNEATRILIGGRLKVDSKATHAQITCAKWTGITVGQNGVLDIDGLDLENAATGIETTAGAGSCVVKNSTIKTSVRPFKVGASSTLTLDHVDASVPATVGQFDSSVAEVFGTLDAKYLKYEAQTNEGIMVKPGGQATITDSELSAHNGQDLISSYGGNTVNVSYTTMTGAHCGVHMQGVKQATFDHITSTGNLYGITIYGADAATVSNSNLSGAIAWLDLQGDHGDVSFTNVFRAPTAGGTDPNAVVGTPIATDPPKTADYATAQVDGAAPRPQ